MDSSSSSNTSVNVSDHARVIILAGQSNMEGNSWINHLENHYDKQQIRLWTEGYESSQIIFNNSWGNYTSFNRYEKVELGQGMSMNHFGPEVGIAETIDMAGFSEPVYMIKFAWGGSNLYNQWRSPSSGETGPLYVQFVDFIKSSLLTLEIKGLTPKIHALCWMQGESDADNNTPNPDSYYQRLKDFITDLREEFNDYACNTGIGFVDAYISDSYVWARYQTVNAAKKQLADEDELNTVIDTIALKLPYDKEPTAGVDPYHYDSNGMIELGRAFGATLFERFLY
ncbi:MAG: sialate O-acetylesterase [Bacilli bacterium]